MGVRDRASGRLRARIAAGACAVLTTIGLGAASADGSSDTRAKTTVEQRIVPAGEDGFRGLGLGPGEGYVVREEGVGTAHPGRAERRESLLYFGQLSDFQLADEESPARVEFLDFGPFSSAWRPYEALLPHIADAMVRQMNEFADASPLSAGDGSRRAMDFVINTGDMADSQQLNEALWVRTIAEGGTLDPGSGVNPATSGDVICAALSPLIADANAPHRYTGVQDFNDFLEGVAPQYYDPDQPAGAFAGWPRHAGLMDAAQEPFEAEGLAVPHFMAFGNHDGLVQGNAAANVAFELVATGCIKPMAPLTADTDTLAKALGKLDLATLLNVLNTDPAKIALVPPDPRRQFVSKQQFKEIFRGGELENGHGFAYVDPEEERASRGAAGYYSWKPTPEFRFIALDTVSEAGVIGPSAEGNIDHPQFLWLQRELAEAERNDELVVLFSHHALASLNASVPDELAPPCTANVGLPVRDAHGHDINPGCDLDPRVSSPIHLAPDLVGLLHAHPNVIAWVAGHSHENAIEAYPNPSGEGGFWSIRVAAEADWPQQSRLLEIFDNGDGTLSIFGTILDHAAPATAPAPGTDPHGLDSLELASIGRTLALNDNQYGQAACDPGCGEGTAEDRNVELLVDDPRDGAEEPPPPPPPPPPGACEELIAGTAGADELIGTAASERIEGRGGGDRIEGRGSGDCLFGGAGADRVLGGAGDDQIKGNRGADRLTGGTGSDAIHGGAGNDRVLAADAEFDLVRCGKGKRDRARVDELDAVFGCERIALVLP
ncbi:MAG TPA: hypothetical protein VIL04_04225 [Solirubrobacterales bacterium]